MHRQLGPRRGARRGEALKPASTGLLDDAAFLEHRTPAGHPERPARLNAIRQRLAADGLAARCTALAAREATDAELLAVHTAGHVSRIDATAGRDVQLDPDTFASPGSARAARLAAGGLVNLARAVVAGDLSNGFALLRPPGHHAEADRAMGFCLYNNVAVATRAARDAGARRTAIVDWDLHHGNGTQNSFWDDPEVLYFSTHQFPFYPGTGSIEETGGPSARGRTVNVPWPGGMGDAEYLAAFDRVLLPIARAFEPDLILVSAGFDAAKGDPLGSMLLSPSGFGRMTERLLTLANGRVVLALEGGYDLPAIAASAAACLRVLLGQVPDAEAPPGPNATADRVLAAVARTQRAWWPALGS